MEKETIVSQLPSDEELLRLAEGIIEKYADALGELA